MPAAATTAGGRGIRNAHSKINHHLSGVALLVVRLNLLAVALLDLCQQRQRIVVVDKAHGFTMVQRFQRAKNRCMTEALGHASGIKHIGFTGLHGHDTPS